MLLLVMHCIVNEAVSRSSFSSPSSLSTVLHSSTLPSIPQEPSPQHPPQHRPPRAPRTQSPSTPQEHRPGGTPPEIVTGLSSVSFLMPSLVLVPTQILPAFQNTPEHSPQAPPPAILTKAASQHPLARPPRRPPGPPPRHLYPPGAPGSDLPP